MCSPSMQHIRNERIQRALDSENHAVVSNFAWYSEYCENLCRLINASMQQTKILTLQGSGFVIPTRLETRSAFREDCYAAQIYSDIEYLKFCVALRSCDPKKHWREPILLHFWFGYFQAMPPYEIISSPKNIH